MHLLFALQDIWLLVQHVLQEVSHDESGTLVLVTRLSKLILQLVVLLLKSFILGLLLYKILLVLFELIFKIIDQFFGGLELILHRKLLGITMSHCLACTQSVITFVSMSCETSIW